MKTARTRSPSVTRICGSGPHAVVAERREGLASRIDPVLDLVDRQLEDLDVAVERRLEEGVRAPAARRTRPRGSDRPCVFATTSCSDQPAGISAGGAAEAPGAGEPLRDGSRRARRGAVVHGRRGARRRCAGDAPGAALGRLGPNDQAGADDAGAQATTLAATRPPPAMAAECRNPRRLGAGRPDGGVDRGGGAVDRWGRAWAERGVSSCPCGAWSACRAARRK